MHWTDIIRAITKLLSNLYNHPVTTLFCVLLLTQNTVLTLPLSFSTRLILPVAQGLKVHTWSMSQPLHAFSTHDNSDTNNFFRIMSPKPFAYIPDTLHPHFSLWVRLCNCTVWPGTLTQIRVEFSMQGHLCNDPPNSFSALAGWKPFVTPGALKAPPLPHWLFSHFLHSCSR